MRPGIQQAIDELGFDEPTPIQEQAIPELLGGHDVIGQAQTGTGKTAAFGLPLLQYLDPSNDEVQAVVLTPTRELCIQVTQALRAYAEHLDVEIVAVFGGAPIKSQQAQLRAGAHVVVATVGRMMDLMSRRSLVLTAARYVVLDEADEMLDLGFIEDVEKILRMCPSGRQTALFSATMPPPVKRLAESYMYDPTTISITPKTLTVDAIAQAFIEVPAKDKASRLVELLKTEEPEQAIIFSRTKIGCLAAGEDAEGQRPRRQGAARRPQPGRPRRGDDLLQGPSRPPPRRHRHRRPRARHRARHPRHQLRRPRLLGGLRAPDRQDRPGRPDRPRDHLRHPGPARRDRAGSSATSRPRSASGRAPRSASSTLPGPRRRERQREKPSAQRQSRSPTKSEAEETAEPKADEGEKAGSGKSVKLFVNRGERSGIAEEDLRWALREGAVLSEDEIHDVRVLHRFSFVEVDPGKAEHAVEFLDGTKLKGKEIRLEIAKS